MATVCHLSKLKQPLELELESGLLQAALYSVFTMCPGKDTAHFQSLPKAYADSLDIMLRSLLTEMPPRTSWSTSWRTSISGCTPERSRRKPGPYRAALPCSDSLPASWDLIPTGAGQRDPNRNKAPPLRLSLLGNGNLEKEAPSSESDPSLDADSFSSPLPELGR
ncbi:uncharacterized protein LOC144260149 [Eretmochelys imbricata]